MRTCMRAKSASSSWLRGTVQTKRLEASSLSQSRWQTTHMFGIVISYSPSLAPAPSRNLTCDSPSIRFAAELPRNLDFGRSSPQSSRPCSGDAKYLRTLHRCKRVPHDACCASGRTRCEGVQAASSPSRDGRVVRDLLRNVVRRGAVRVVVPAAEELAENGVVPAKSSLCVSPPALSDDITAAASQRDHIEKCKREARRTAS